jgi:hypothetical protein
MSFSDINRIYAETDLWNVTTTTLTIEVDPATIARTTVAGVNLPADAFTVTRVGTETLNYTIADDAAWLNVSPASGTNDGEIDSIQVTYDVGGLPAGAHAATITVSDPQASNDPQHVAVTVTVEPGAHTTAGFYQPGWNLTSVPVTPTNPEAGGVFQDLADLGNTIAGNLHRYDPLSGYGTYPGAFADVSLGRGYWLWLDTAGAQTVVSVAGTAAAANVVMLLSEGWNLIGHPFPAVQPLADCHVRNVAVTRSFEQAVAAGWVGGALYRWEPGAGYRMVRTEPFGHDESLRPWCGYWVCALAPDLQLIFPVP